MYNYSYRPLISVFSIKTSNTLYSVHKLNGCQCAQYIIYVLLQCYLASSMEW